VGISERNLPALPDDGDVEEMVFDGEVVEEAAPGASAQPPARAVIVQVVHTVVVVVQHPVPRATVRHAAYIPRGAAALMKRRQHGRTIAQRMAVELHRQGKSAEALLLLTHEQDSRQSAHERWKGRVDMLVTLAAHWKPITVCTAGGMLGIGMALHNPAAPFEAAAAVVRDAWTAAVWSWRIGVYAGPAGLLAWLYRAGRRESAWSAKWDAVSADSDVDVLVDERAVTQALRQLNLKPINDHLKGGAPLAFIVPCRIEGRGTYCEIRLPGGIPAIEITKQKRREGLAAGLYRHTKEVHPSVGSDNSILKLWAADKGALDGGAGPYPLLSEGFTDVFKGLPFGKTLRGDPSRIPVIGRNTLIGGMPEQGKSNGGRVVAAGYTLDIVTELRIYVPDTNFDFERFAPRCSRYVMGAEDEHMERILGDLEELKDELQVRGQILVDREQEEVTWQLAHAGIGLHPVFVLLEEAHIAIQHQRLGKDFQQLLCDIVKLDRKRGIHMMISTQAPTKDSMPRDVTRNCTNGIAYAVGDHVANDALLGQGAYRAGHRATELIPGADRGTALCKGFGSEARSEMVQAHRVSGREGDDQVTPMVNRALGAMAAAGRAVPGTDRPLAIVERDLLADLAEVTKHRGGKVRVSELPDLLHNLAPSWGAYRRLNGTQLRELLFAEGVRTTNPGNVPTLDLDELRAVIRQREGEVS
jgi:S-DNA-T family DNA segregation ATPase FtsK/SpoIIIE